MVGEREKNRRVEDKKKIEETHKQIGMRWERHTEKDMKEETKKAAETERN